MSLPVCQRETVFHHLMMHHLLIYNSCKINLRENRRGNQEWIIQRLLTLGTQDTGEVKKHKKKHKKKTTQHNTEN